MSTLPIEGLEAQRPRAGRAQMTERHMLDLLHARYSAASQGDSIRFACAEHVAAHTGWTDAEGNYGNPRIADFIAQDCHSGQGLHLIGHEVKVSRADWLAELRSPTKAEAIKRYCDRWFLVVPDKSIVHDDLPADWGLMVIGKDGRLRVSRRAPALDPEPTPPTFRAALLRAAAKTNARRGSVIAQKDAEIARLRDRFDRLAAELRTARVNPIEESQ